MRVSFLRLVPSIYLSLYLSIILYYIINLRPFCSFIFLPMFSTFDLFQKSVIPIYFRRKHESTFTIEIFNLTKLFK